MTITRERHPFEGRALAVIGSTRRRGVLFVLACLPDGSRALIPAQWTDWDEGHYGGVRACREVMEVEREATLKQWRLGVERANYEAQRAERRYRAVDPDNWLVARGLERDWEERLRLETGFTAFTRA